MGLLAHHGPEQAVKRLAAGASPSPPRVAFPDGRRAHEDLERILGLPWGFEATPDLTPALARLGGAMTLRPVQSQALAETRRVGGLLGAIPVGSGKTLVALLAPKILGSSRPLLLIPAALRDQCQRDIERYGRHFDLPVVTVRSYESLSTPDRSGMLSILAPDLIIADEAHKLRYLRSVRSRRVARYLKEHPECRFVGLSGTITRGAIRDFGHLAAWALGERSPLPLGEGLLVAWDKALAEEGVGASGPLFSPVCARASEPRPRLALQTHLAGAPGVALAAGEDAECSLVLRERRLDVPAHLQVLVDRVERTSRAPNGDELESPLAVARVLGQLACGFYYYWDWSPEPWCGSPDEPWLETRSAWHKAVRQTLESSFATEKRDSPMLLAGLCARGVADVPDRLMRAWQAWRPHRDKVSPPVLPCWVDRHVVEDAVAWARREDDPPLLWYAHRAVGDELVRLSPGWERFGEGADASRRLAAATTPRPGVIALAAHGHGKNLQVWGNQIFVAPIRGGATFEQCLDAETEILTASGWYGIDASWDAHTLVAAYNVDDASITWEPGARVERRLGAEEMWGICNPHLDIRVTAGHRMVVQRRRRFGPNGRDGFAYSDRSFVEAANMLVRARLPVAGDQAALGVPLTDDELVFLGIVMSDGYVSKNRRVLSVFQSDRYPEVVKEFERVVTSCGFRASRRTVTAPTNFGPRRFPLHYWTISRGKAEGYRDGLRGWYALDKYVSRDFPDALEDLTAAQLRCVLRGMWLGNGFKTKGTYVYDKYVPHTMDICVGRRLTANRVQSICARRGMRCNISYAKEHLWTLRISDNAVHTLTTVRCGDGRPAWGVLRSMPDERVWCATVSTGAIVTRRNGKIAIVGNCLGRTHRLGQARDEVTATVYVHGPFQDAMAAAMASAERIEETTGQAQRLRYASRVRG